MRFSLRLLMRNGFPPPIATLAYIAEFVVPLEMKAGNVPTIARDAHLRSTQADIRNDPDLRKRIDAARTYLKRQMTRVNEDEKMNLESRFKVGIMQAEVR